MRHRLLGLAALVMLGAGCSSGAPGAPGDVEPASGLEPKAEGIPLETAVGARPPLRTRPPRFLDVAPLPAMTRTSQ